MPFTWWNRLFPRARSFQRRWWRPLERLEDRTTPAVTALPPVGGLLTVNLSAAGDEARLGVAGANLEVRDGTNTLILATPAAGVTALSFLGVSAGNQTVVWNDTVTITGSAALAGISTFTINGTYSIGTTLTATLGGPGAGGISDGATGIVTVGGLTNLNGGVNTITLNNANDFQGNVSVVLASDVAIGDANDLSLGSVNATGTVSVSAGSAIIDGNGAILNVTAAALAAAAATGIGSGDALETAVVTMAAVDTVSGSIQVSNTGALTITTVGTVPGVSLVGATAGNIRIDASSPLTINADVVNTTGGEIVLTATNDGGNDDNLTVNARIIASGGNGSITLNAGTDLVLNDSGASPDISTAGTGAINLNVVRNALINANVQVVTAGGPINLTTDDASISGTASLTGGIVTITTTTAGRVIDLGTDTAGRLGLTDVELDRITATTLRIGTAANTGGIDNTAPVSPAGTTVLSLQTAGAITDTAAGGITIANLAARGNGVALGLGAHAVGTLAGVSTAGFSFTNTIGLTVGTVDGAVGIVSSNGDVVITADDVNIAAPVNAGTGCAIIQPLTANRPIDIGTETAGSLSLTNTELNFVTARALRVGSTTAGAISVTQAINLMSTATLALRSGAAVSEAAAGTLAATNLGVQAGAGITLTNANAVGTLAASAGAAIAFVNAPNLIVGSVDVCDPAPLTGLTAPNAAITVTVTGAGNLLTVNNAINAGNGAIVLTADDMAINAAINSGTQPTTLVQQTAGRPISLGGDFGGSLFLTDAELDQITAAQINIGNAASGDVISLGPISPAGTTTLRIQSGGAIVADNAGTDITVANLALIAVNGIGSANAFNTVVSNLAFTNGANSVQVANIGNLTIAAVAGVATSTSGSTATITALGGITFAVDVTTTGSLLANAMETTPSAPNVSNIVVNGGVTVRSTAADVTLLAGDRVTLNGTVQANQLIEINSALLSDNDSDGMMTLNGNLIATNITLNVGGADGATQTGGTITADGLLLLSTDPSGSFSLTQGGNNVNRLAALTNGSINYTDANAFTVGFVNGALGINTGGTNLTLTAGGLLTLGDGTAFPQPITATGATVDLFAAGITQNANGPIVADNLRVRGTGTFTLLNPNNNIITLAADVTGPISFRDANALTVGAVLGTAGIRVQGINANVDAVTIFVGSDLTIAQIIDAGGIGGGNITANIGQTTVGTLTQNVELSARRATFNGGNAVTPGGVGDTFLIRPSATTPIFVDGNLPTVPIGDSLRLFLNQGEQGLMFTPGVVGAGTFTFTNRATVSFVEIETLTQLNLLAFVLQTGPANFTITAQGRIEQQVSGTVPLAPIATNPFVVSPQFVDPNQPFGAPRLAVGDVNGDGIPDLIVAFGPNNAPLVTIFDGGDVFRALPNPRILSQFFAYDPSFFGGVFVAAADFDGDGRAEIVTGPDRGGGPHVRVLRFDPNVANVNANVGNYPGPLGNFFPFAPNFTGGVRVATGDVNGDGRPDIVTAAGPGGGPHVRTFNGVTGLQLDGPLGSFFAYETTFTGGVFVAVADYNSDGNADIMTGPGVGGSARIRIFSGLNGVPLADFNAFPPPGPDFPYPPTGAGGTSPFPNETAAFNGVGSLAFADLDGDNNLDIIVGSGRGQAARIRAFRGNRMTPVSVISDFVNTSFRDGFGVATFVDPQFGG